MAAGIFATVTIASTEVTSMSDLNVAVKWDTAEASDRATAIKTFVKTQCDLPVTGKLRVDDTAGSLAAMAMLFSHKSKVVTFLSGPAADAGTWGIKGPFILTEAGGDNGLSVKQFHDVVFKAFPDTTEKFHFGEPAKTGGVVWKEIKTDGTD
jgi:hypothetical protein